MKKEEVNTGRLKTPLSCSREVRNNMKKEEVNETQETLRQEEKVFSENLRANTSGKHEGKVKVQTE